MVKKTHFSLIVTGFLPVAAVKAPAANSPAAIVLRHHFSSSVTAQRGQILLHSGHLIHAARRTMEAVGARVTLSLGIKKRPDLLRLSKPIECKKEKKRKNDCDRKQMREGEKKSFFEY